MMPRATNPIVVKRKPSPEPIIPTSRWRLVGRPGVLMKTYAFKERHERDDFVVAVLGQEATTGADSELSLRGLEVTIVLVTADLGIVTDGDREHARACDVLFKEVTYLPVDGPDREEDDD